MVNALIQLRLALKTNADFQHFFDNFFVFSQWPLIFQISNINTSLYRFLLKFFNFGIYTSLPFLVSNLVEFFFLCSINPICLNPLCFIIRFRSSFQDHQTSLLRVTSQVNIQSHTVILIRSICEMVVPMTLIDISTRILRTFIKIHGYGFTIHGNVKLL